MKKFFCLVFLVCIVFVSEAKQPNTPYFSHINMFDLLPYTKAELAYFKEKGVSQIEIDRANEFKEVQYFNEQSQLTKIEYYNISKKKDKLLGGVEFLYDKNGRLIRKLQNEGVFFTIDSLADDDNGIIDYYAFVGGSNSKRFPSYYKTIEYKFSHFDSNGYKVLTESFGHTKYDFQVILDSNNVIWKDITPYRTDSLAFLNLTKDTVLEIEYVFQSSSEIKLRKGLEKIYFDNILIRENCYQLEPAKERIDYSVFYYYDNLKRLIKSENDHFYTKNEYLFSYVRNTNLISEKIWIYGEKTSVEHYSYIFR